MERDPRRYGEEPVPPLGIPESEEEATERSLAQQEEDQPRPGEPSFDEDANVAGVGGKDSKPSSPEDDL